MNPLEPLRVGIVGCGNIAFGEHAPALRALQGVQVVALADPTEASLHKVQARLDLPASACFTDHRALLNAGVDYVTLTVPPRYRRPIVEDCARAGVHVITEKPLATIPADAQAMIETMRAAQLCFGMVHNYLYYPEYVLAHQLIQSGAIGELRHVLLNFMGMPDNPGAAEYRPWWRHDPVEAGGGVLMDMVHAVYVAEFFGGGPIRSVSAILDNTNHSGKAIEDLALVNYALDRSYASVNMWWGGGPGGVEFSGTEGRILIFYRDFTTGPFVELESFTLVNRKGRQELDARPIPYTRDNFVQIHKDFAEAVRTGREPVAPAENGLRALEAVLGAYMSAAAGRVVSLPLSQEDPVFQRGARGFSK